MELGILFICFPLTGILGSEPPNCPDGNGTAQETATVCSCAQHKTIGCDSGHEIVIIDVFLEKPHKKSCKFQNSCKVSKNKNCPYYMSNNCQQIQPVQLPDIFTQCNGMRNCSFDYVDSVSEIPCSRSVKSKYHYLLTAVYGCEKAASSTPPVTSSTTSHASQTSLPTSSSSSTPTLPTTASTNPTSSVTRPATTSTSQGSLTTPSSRSTSPLPPRGNTSYATERFQETSKKSSAGLYAGIGIGCVAAIIAVSVLSVLCWRRKGQSRSKNSHPEVVFNNYGYNAPNVAAGGSSSQVTIGHNLAQGSSASHDLPKGEEDYSYATPLNFAGSAELSSGTPVKAPTNVYQEYDDSNVRHNSGVGVASEDTYTQSSKKGNESKAFIKSTDSELQPPVPIKSPDLTSGDTYNYVNPQGIKIPQTATNKHPGRIENDYQEYDDDRDRLYETTDPEPSPNYKSETSTKAAEPHSPSRKFDVSAEEKEDEDESAPYQEYETSEDAGDYTYADRYRPTRIMQQVRDNLPVLSSDYGAGNLQESASYAYANVEEK